MNRLRNTFNKKPPIPNGVSPLHDENGPPPTSATPATSTDSASIHSSYAGSRASSTLSIKKKEEPPEYKLSVVNGGVYLPPSPPEKKSFWPKSPISGRTSNHRSVLNENEPFSISRESFESYRRSFDISARSPVFQQDSSTPRQSLDTRQSLDSGIATSPRPRRLNPAQFERHPPADEEDGFEDVGLNGVARPLDEIKHVPTKKRGIFARFGDSNSEPPPVSPDAPRPSSSHRGFHLPGRKRGQSGQGAELGNIDRSGTQEGEDGIVR